MATGIEMLGQMGTDQSLAGPVQGGNMVVKPNQVPVGGAAMLSKALRRQAVCIARATRSNTRFYEDSTK